jgi:hypothetical protein
LVPGFVTLDFTAIAAAVNNPAVSPTEFLLPSDADVLPFLDFDWPSNLGFPFQVVLRI